MEDENQTNFTSKPFLPLAVGLAGAVLGVASLAVAINAASRASTAEENFKTMKDGVERAAALSIEMKNMSSKMEDAMTQVNDIKSAGATNVNALSRQMQSAINSLSAEISKNRSLIAENQKAIGEVASRGGRPRATQPSQGATAADSAQQGASAGGKVHNVRPGETLLVIAKKYGKKLSEIQAANPGVDSKRLQIGQEIAIP